ncbi:uncharacterized protein [Pocillopora verrucosa]|uniref:uncharacterized protein n=1 Tax=Pocillopora verrucosa TaxID=203993 RepID=UPI003342A3E3
MRNVEDFECGQLGKKEVKDVGAMQAKICLHGNKTGMAFLARASSYNSQVRNTSNLFSTQSRSQPVIVTVREGKMRVLLLSLFLICGAFPSHGRLYRLIVKTARASFAGTDAVIRIRIQGTRGDLKERVINGRFEQDGTDLIDIYDYDIGYIKGADIKRNNAGFLPDWKLDKITIKVAGAEDSIFNYYDWVPQNKWVELPLSCPNGSHKNTKGFCDGECLSMK